ncbi:MAG: thermonuclease family protein [Reyranella sp.]
MTTRLGLLLGACLAFAPVALADVTVVDGDTIIVGGEAFDLHGIVAPEHRQICADGTPAGVIASEVLRELVRDRTVTCEPKARSRYSPTVGVCLADGLDLGSLMVRSGWAWAFVQHSANYLPQEAAARAARIGVHAHDCIPPQTRQRFNNRKSTQ